MMKTIRHIIPVYAAALILSAFLLFSIQPLFTKMVLPLLGGSPSVWNTAMVFFQSMLLFGYIYAHVTSKYFTPRRQAIIHLGLLSLCVLTLPIHIPEGAIPPAGLQSPLFWQLGIMAIAMGTPFLILSGTAPILQRWFASTGHPDAANPYFLYSASNFGSLAALLAYPTLIETAIGTGAQSNLWSAAYIALIVLIGLAAFTIGHQSPAVQNCLLEKIQHDDPRPSARERLQWIVLAFIPSSLMLSVTTYITTDIASIPLLWILPLMLYLVTFIMAFARRPLIRMETAYLFMGVLMVILAVLFIKNSLGASLYSIAVHLGLFFLCALCSHIALAGKKPPARDLTEFYIFISVGGALGGIFNTLVAPAIFPVTFEYPLGLLAAMSIPFIAGRFPINAKELRDHSPILSVVAIVSFFSIFINQSLPLQFICSIIVIVALLRLMDRDAHLAMAAGIALIFIFHPGYDWSSFKRTIFLERNFYGISKVFDSPDMNRRIFMNGTTIHGEQALVDPYKKTPLTYYYPGGPAGDIFKAISSTLVPQNIAVLGLGAGSVACYQQTGRHFDFYEIDPAVIRIAEDKTLYTYLSDCDSPYRIIQGDARLTLAGTPDQSYDMIFIDVFSSDSIPVHMTTREAFQLYFKKLKPDGIILINISNRHLDIKPLIAAIAMDQNAEARFAYYIGKKLLVPGISSFDSRYAIISRNQRFMQMIDKDYKHWSPYTGPLVRVWTDDYTNFLSLLARPSAFRKKEDY